MSRYLDVHEYSLQKKKLFFFKCLLKSIWYVFQYEIVLYWPLNIAIDLLLIDVLCGDGFVLVWRVVLLSDRALQCLTAVRGSLKQRYWGPDSITQTAQPTQRESLKSQPCHRLLACFVNLIMWKRELMNVLYVTKALRYLQTVLCIIV